jgi:Phage integrase, N-terminal
MRDLNYDLKQLCRHNRDGSYATQADREHILDLIADAEAEGNRSPGARGHQPRDGSWPRANHRAVPESLTSC